MLQKLVNIPISCNPAFAEKTILYAFTTHAEAAFAAWVLLGLPGQAEALLPLMGILLTTCL